MSSSVDLKIDWCAHAAAKFAVENWHYSQVMPCPPHVKLGVWENGKYIGCVIFSRGATGGIGKPYGLRQTEVCELTRVALCSHVSPVTRIVSIALRFLRRSNPGIKLVISYADPSKGHLGSIYQAGNWVYVGQSPKTIEYIAPSGKRVHGRMVSPSGRTKVYGKYRAVLRPEQCTRVECPGKYKYLMPLDAAIREKILQLAKQPPKALEVG